MRLIVFLPILALFHISDLITFVDAAGDGKNAKKGDGKKGDGKKGKPAKGKGNGAAKKGGDGKAKKGGAPVGGKGKARKAEPKRRPLLNFEDLDKDMDLKSSRVGYFKWFRVEMPASTHVLRVRSKWGDECADYYEGLQNREVSASWRIQPVLEALDYEVCSEPLEAYSFENDYTAPVMDYHGDESDAKQTLVCTFQQKSEEKRTITVARASLLVVYRLKPRLMSRMRARLGSKRNAEAEVKECLSMLDNYIKIQNLLVDQYEESTGISAGKLRLPEIAGAQVKAIAQRQADEEHTDEASGLGAGYIVLIIFGVLVALGGAYYGYTKCTSKGQATSKDTAEEELERGGKRKRRSDRNRNQPDARVVHVVGRPVPI